MTHLPRLPLFDQARALSRRSDPSTSKAAARRHVESGTSVRNIAIVFDAVKKYPGRTAVELCAMVDLERHEISRRLSDLRREGSVWNGDKRKCRVSGTVQLTWYPA